MAIVKDFTAKTSRNDERFYLDILSESETGWELRLPPILRIHQHELEQMLTRVFSGRPTSRENFALAQQMSLNWCFSKCKQAGRPLEDCLAEAV